VNLGIFVELLPGVEGLCHNSEIPAEMRATHPPLPIGEEMVFKIIKMSEADKRIGLTLAQEHAAVEKQRIEDYQKQAEQARINFEEALEADSASETAAKRETETETGSEQE